METLTEQFQALSAPDWISTVTALVYVLLASRDSNWCWPFAAVSAAVWAYQSYFAYQLVSDALLQLFYLAMAFVGLYRWRKLSAGATSPAGGPRPIRRMAVREHLVVIVGGALLGGLLGALIDALGNAAFTYLDAMTTAFSLVTTFLLIQRKLENWLYWIVIDAVYVYIYLRSGALLFALLMVLYTLLAGYGYYRWRSAVDGSDHVAA